MDPCISCNFPVRTRQEALACDGCHRWQHRTCQTGILHVICANEQRRRRLAPRTSQTCLGSRQPAILHVRRATLQGSSPHCTPDAPCLRKETAPDSEGQVPLPSREDLQNVGRVPGKQEGRRATPTRMCTSKWAS